MIAPLARFAVRRPVAVLAGWALAVVVLAVIGRGVEEKLNPTELVVEGTETARWAELREGHFGQDAAVLLRGPADAIDRQGPALSRALVRREHTRALSPWTGESDGDELRPSPNEAMIVLDLEIPPGENQSTIIPPLERFVEERVEAPVEPHIAGNAPLGRDLNEATTSAIHSAERLAFPVLIIVLLLVFRTPVAAAIPLLVALGTTQGGFGVISLITGFADLDAITLSLASMIGLALGVDYSLLIVSRFREALDSGLRPRQAASLAANTAGRTAVFAGVVLIGIMLVSFFLSPGTVLLSSAVGAIVVTFLSMAGAALVAPSAVTLLGHRVNKWQIGAPPGRANGRTGVFPALVRRVARRPALFALTVMTVLLLVAAPVLAVDTAPPDPRQLPEGSEGREDFQRVRAAGFGPAVDVVVTAPDGAITGPERLRRIKRLERRLRRVPNVDTVVGPGIVGEQTEEIRNAPEAIERAERDLAKGERDLTRLERGLRGATAGVAELRAGLRDASAGSRDLAAGSRDAQAGADELAGGAARAEEGAEAVAAGSERAAEGTSSLTEGLDQAYEGAGRLSEGATEARRSSEQLEAGSAELEAGLQNELAPGADQLAAELRRGQAGLTALRLPARVTEQQLQAAAETLDAMTVGRTDPLYAQAVQQVNTALAAATGSAPIGNGADIPGYPGLDAALGQAADEAGAAAAAADELAAGAREAAGGASDLNEGIGDLTGGLRDLERGADRLQDGLGRARVQVAAAEGGLDRLAQGSDQLAAGVGELSDGASELESGLGAIAAGNRELAGELAAGARRSEPLQSGLGDATGEVAMTRDQLLNETGPFAPLRDLDRLQRESPGFFESGYLTVAALDGARPLDRETSLYLVDSNQGGEAGRIQLLPDVPTNDPRTAEVVDDVRAVTDDFADRTGMRAAAGGAAGQLVDFDRVTASRIPLLVVLISLVTYLLLVPILRSLLLPLIAVGLNLLTVAAGFGVLTLLFVGDDPPLGGAGALDVISVAGIFSITFALSIDYQVFLLTRMREEYVRTQSGDDAIHFGIQKTAKVVTGAAAIMISVFVAFALSDFTVIKQFGIGLAVAVFIDATIVRLVLLPALMRLAGERAWWLPGWLDDKLPVLDVEGSAYEREVRQFGRA